MSLLLLRSNNLHSYQCQYKSIKKSRNGLTPKYLQQLVLKRSDIRNRHTRNSGKGRTIRKVMGGGGGGGGEGKKPKKNSCKEEGKEKKFVQKEGPTPGPAI